MVLSKYRSGRYAKKAYKAAKRYTRPIRSAVRKRYSGASAIPNLLKDVSMLKHLVNIEKKRYDNTQSTAVAFAQSNGVGVSGQFSAIISPKPDQGTAQGQRVGASIKVVSGVLDMQITQQSATLNALKVKYWVVKRPDNSSSYSANLSVAQFLEPNPFSGINDYYSSRDSEFFTAFKVVKSGTMILAQDQITSGVAIKQIKVPLSFNDHLKFPNDASVVTTKNQFYLFIQCSGGDVLLNTGCTVVYNMRWYYTDN